MLERGVSGNIKCQGLVKLVTPCIVGLSLNGGGHDITLLVIYLHQPLWAALAVHCSADRLSMASAQHSNTSETS